MIARAPLLLAATILLAALASHAFRSHGARVIRTEAEAFSQSVARISVEGTYRPGHLTRAVGPQFAERDDQSVDILLDDGSDVVLGTGWDRRSYYRSPAEVQRWSGKRVRVTGHFHVFGPVPPLELRVYNNPGGGILCLTEIESIELAPAPSRDVTSAPAR